MFQPIHLLGQYQGALLGLATGGTVVEFSSSPAGPCYNAGVFTKQKKRDTKTKTSKLFIPRKSGIRFVR